MSNVLHACVHTKIKQFVSSPNGDWEGALKWREGGGEDRGGIGCSQHPVADLGGYPRLV